MHVNTHDWTSALSEQDSLRVLECLGTIHAQQGGLHGYVIHDMIQRRDYTGLCNYVLPVSEDGWDILQLIHCRQALALFQKYEPLPLGISKEAVAYQAYVDSELLCGETNSFFRTWEAGRLSPHPFLVKCLYSARQKIQRILGRAPTIDELKLRFGPGSTTSITKTKASWQEKLAEAPTCSLELLHSHVFPSLCRSMPHWLKEHQEECETDEDGDVVIPVTVTVAEGKLQFVPKNAKTYRSIDVQPTLNTMLQCAIGDWMERLLGKVGIDIRDQSKNQRLAREGSLCNNLATLDLSSASDTIAYALVRFLIPEEWFALLRASCCGTTEYRGSSRRLEKFSSMGNGFTFPLETLIFWALSKSACEGIPGEVSAYGDDIIVPREGVAPVKRILRLCGFLINEKKSYADGPFRESCGADYYNGIQVRPIFYAKEALSVETLFLLHNQYYRDLQRDMADVVLELIPDHLRLYGPDGYGDGHLLSEEWPRIRSRKARRDGWEGYFFETYRHLGCFVPSKYPGDYVTPLYSIYMRDGGGSPEETWFKTVSRCVTPERQLHEIIAALREGRRQRVINAGRNIGNISAVRNAESSRCMRPSWSTPGTNGYEKARIYTLAR